MNVQNHNYLIIYSPKRSAKILCLLKFYNTFYNICNNNM